MPPMGYYVAWACTEQESPCHRLVCQGVVKEAYTAGVGGDSGEDLPGLQGTVGDHDSVQIYGKSADGEGRKLTCSVR